MNILGISGYYHDSAAAVVKDGIVLAAAQEERFTRKKADASFPAQSVSYCLREANLKIPELDAIVFYDKPFLKFERLLETYISYAPRGLTSYLKAMPIWLKEKLFLKRTIRSEMCELNGLDERALPPLLFTQHHQSHAASAFFPSPFQEAAVICLDGVGEWATTTIWHGKDNDLNLSWSVDFPHSIGLLYSAFTYYTGFKVNFGEYKMMGLAPYGEPRFKDLILRELIDFKDDGSFMLNMSYFSYAHGHAMTNDAFHKLFGAPPRPRESQITQREMDIASSIQVVTEEIVLRLANAVQKDLGLPNLCMAGGVALNCVANGRLLREGRFKKIWIQPAAGDAGGAVGAALAAYHQHFGKSRVQVPEGHNDLMRGSFLGPQETDSEISRFLDREGVRYEKLNDQELYDRVSTLLSEENVIGWVQGRMEFGPRSLGNRSILGDPRSPKMQSVMNLKIKYRESFRPFAPAVLEEDVAKYFDLETSSPYMLLVAPVKKERQRTLSDHEAKLFGIEKLNVPRSDIPAVTHVDYSARVQTVSASTNPEFHRLLESFKQRTGCSVLVNTSFNVRGEPIVCASSDAYRCFMRTEMDYLVLGHFLISKRDQDIKAWRDSQNWRSEYELD